MKKIRGIIFSSEGVFEPGEITVCKNRIEKVEILDTDELTVEEKHRKIIPGLVDIHTHGAAGVDICRCSPEEIDTFVSYENDCGITSVCVATMTLDEEKLIEICNKLASASKIYTQIKGIYLEGPFIAESRCGAQNPKHVRKPDFDLYTRLQKVADNSIKVVTIAPEVAGATEFTKTVDKTKCVVSIAHTEADACEAERAFAEGVSHVTHIYNAMKPMTHRKPGVIGAAADDDRVTVELICDGVHVDPIMVRNTFRLFGRDRIILVSDSMEATGMADGEYMLGDRAVNKRGNRALIGDTLAGSVTNLYDCMTNAIRFGVKENDAIIAASTNPAKKIGIYNETGSIEAGKAADILVVSKDYELLKVIRDEDDIDK